MYLSCHVSWLSHARVWIILWTFQKFECPKQSFHALVSQCWLDPCWIHAYVSLGTHCQGYSSYLVHNNVMWWNHNCWQWFLDLHSCICCSIVGQSSYSVSNWMYYGWVGQQQFDWSYRCCFDEVWGFNKGKHFKKLLCFDANGAIVF